MTSRWNLAPKKSLAVGLMALIAQASVAEPEGGVVRAGTARISGTPEATTITQLSDRAVIDWTSFNIANGESVTFEQPSVGAAVLNRVTGSQLSSLEGALRANGQLYLVNPNGIVIGSGATINAASFIASTANIGTNAFMSSPSDVNGRFAFDEPAAQAGSIANNGTITVAERGLVALVAPSVQNSGVITARLGKIELASANYFTLDLFGDSLVHIAVDDSIASALRDTQGNPVTTQIAADGQLLADGGRIALLTVRAAEGVVDLAINLSGIARAQSVERGANGEILLRAVGGRIRISGTLDTTDATVPDTDGLLTVAVFGNNRVIGRQILRTSTARILGLTSFTESNPSGGIRPDGDPSPSTDAVDALEVVPVAFDEPSTPVDATGSSTPDGAGIPDPTTGLTTTGPTSGRPGVARSVDVGRRGDLTGSSVPEDAGVPDSTTGLTSGGPGVARSVDVGRSGDLTGANVDVFGVNFHVLTPAQGESDAQIAEYLCKTPFSLNGCEAQRSKSR